jgi:hypothetical protein
VVRKGEKARTHKKKQKNKNKSKKSNYKVFSRRQFLRAINKAGRSI